MEQKVSEHEATIDPNEPRDFIDKVLVEMRATTDPASSFYGEQGRQNLVETLMDLFAAGSETTSTTLTWAMLYMVREPAVQDRLQAQLTGVRVLSLYVWSTVIYLLHLEQYHHYFAKL
jgi:cytochrome P450